MVLRRIVWVALAALSVALIAHALWRDAEVLLRLLRVQILGADYSCFWAGAKTALHNPSRLYDFLYITDVQGWPLGPRDIRPYIYPPPALFVFIPFSLGSYWAGFAAWVALTGALYFWAALKSGAPWWVALAPCVLLVADCGQMPFIMGGLIIGALAIADERPNVAGILLGVAACLKPQFVLLVPVALVAQGSWRTLIVAGVTGAVLCVASAMIWGFQIWFDWLEALPRFKQLVVTNRGLIWTGATPYAWLTHAGYHGAWAYLLAPFAIAAVWFAFSRPAEPADRLLALFGATIVISPYAMNYEYVLLAPSVAIYLTRVRDPRWPAYMLCAAGFFAYIWNPPALYFALALPLVRYTPAPLAIAPPQRGFSKSGGLEAGR